MDDILREDHNFDILLDMWEQADRAVWVDLMEREHRDEREHRAQWMKQILFLVFVCQWYRRRDLEEELDGTASINCNYTTCVALTQPRNCNSMFCFLLSTTKQPPYCGTVTFVGFCPDPIGAHLLRPSEKISPSCPLLPPPPLPAESCLPLPETELLLFGGSPLVQFTSQCGKHENGEEVQCSPSRHVFPEWISRIEQHGPI